MPDFKTHPSVNGAPVALAEEAFRRRPNLFPDPLWSKLPNRTTGNSFDIAADPAWALVNTSSDTVISDMNAVDGVLSITFSLTSLDLRLLAPKVRLDKSKTYTFSFEVNKSETNFSSSGGVNLRGGTGGQVSTSDKNLASRAQRTALEAGWVRVTCTVTPADMDGDGDWAHLMVNWDWNQTRSGTIRYRNFMLHEGAEPQRWNPGPWARDYAEAAKAYADEVAAGLVGAGRLVTLLPTNSKTEADGHNTYPDGISVLRVGNNNAAWPLSNAYLVVTTTKHSDSSNTVTQEAQEWWAGANRRWWRSALEAGAWGPWREQIAGDDLRLANGMEILERAEAAWMAAAYTPGAPHLHDLSGNGHHARLGSTWQIVGGALHLPGVAGNYASTPDTPKLRVTGDLDLRVKVALVDWTPSAAQSVIARWATTTGGRAFGLYVSPAGALVLQLSSDGNTNQSATSTVPVAAADGAAVELRATYRQSDGQVRFYTRAPGAAVWDPLGAAITSAAAGLHPAQTVLEVGAQNGGSQIPLAGRIYSAEVRNGIDGPVVASFTPAAAPDAAATITAPTGETWTVHATTGADAGDPLYLPYTGEKYLYLPEEPLNWVAPSMDGSVFGGPGALDVRVDQEGFTGPGVPASGRFVDSPIYCQRSTNEFRVGARYDDGGTVTFPMITIGPAPSSLPARCPLRVTFDPATRGFRLFTAPAGSSLTDDGVWTEVGTATLPAAAGQFTGATSTPIRFGAGPTDGANGRLYRALVYKAGTLLCDFDPSRSAEPHNTVPGGAGETWTINRSAAGRKTALVDRPLFLFGDDDYMVVPHHPALNFEPSTSFTVAVVARRHGLTGFLGEVFIAKTVSGVPSGDGWLMMYSQNGDRPRGTAPDGTTRLDLVGDAAPSGKSHLMAFTRSVELDRGSLYSNGSTNNAVTDPTTGAFANSLDLHIGCLANTTAPTNFEFIGAAIFREALTGDELAALERLFLSAHVPPTPHARTHAIGGSDPLTPEMIGAASSSDPRLGQTAHTVAYKTAAFGPNSYPVGVSHMEVHENGVTDGYPRNFALVVTDLLSVTRGVQTLTDRTTGSQWYRVPNSTGSGWEAWKEVITSADVVTDSRFVAEIAYKAAAAGPGEYPTGVSTMNLVLGAEADGWPAGTSLLVTAKQSDHRMAQTVYLKWASPVRMWVRSPNNDGTGWTAWREVVWGDDARLSDSRTPTDGSVTNAKVAAGAAIDLSKLNIPSNAAAGTPSLRSLGTGATNAAAGNDARFTNQRVPTDGSVTDAKVAAGAAIAESKLNLASDAAPGTASRRTLGTGANQAAPGNATVNLTGDQTVAGTKNFTSRPQVNGAGVLLEGEGGGGGVVEVLYRPAADHWNTYPVGVSVMNLPSGATNDGWPTSLAVAVTTRHTDSGRVDQTVTSAGAVTTQYVRTAHLMGVWTAWRQVAWDDQLVADAAAGTPSLRTLGTGSQQAAQGSTTVRTSGNQTISGVKNFTTRPTAGSVQLATVNDLLQLPAGVVRSGTRELSHAGVTAELTFFGPWSIFTATDRRYKITCHFPWITMSNTSTQVRAAIRRTPGNLALTTGYLIGSIGSIHMTAVIVGTGTTEDFYAQLARTVGTGTVNAEFSATQAGYFIVEDIGPNL